jgi:hypothetical protein
MQLCLFLLVTGFLSLNMQLPLLLLAGSSCLKTVMADSPRRSLATLAEKWNITDPTFEYTSLSFDLDFGVSDYIVNGMADFSIWDGSCQEGNVSVANTTLIGTLVPIVGAQGDGSGFKRGKIDITIAPEEVTTNTNVYREATVEGELLGFVNFCVRFSLTTGGASPIEVNFLETVVTLVIEFTDGFSIGSVSLDKRAKLIRTANQVYSLEGYQCNLAHAELTTAQKNLAKTQGSVLRVCVRPDAEARSDGVYMREIIEFTFSRDSPAASQIAVENGGPSSDGLTDLFCTAGDAICSFSTILTAQFYRLSGFVTGSGLASMQFGSAPPATRHLLHSGGGRATQEEVGVASISEFEMFYGTLSAVDAYRSGASRSTGCFVVLTFLSFLAGSPFLL